MLFDPRRGDPRPHFPGGGVDYEALNECRDDGIKHLLGLHPGAVAHINDVFGMELEVGDLGGQNGRGVHNKGLRVRHRATDDQHAAPEGLGSEAAARGNDTHSAGPGQERSHAGGCHLTQDVDLVGVRRGKIEEAG